MSAPSPPSSRICTSVDVSHTVNPPALCYLNSPSLTHCRLLAAYSGWLQTTFSAFQLVGGPLIGRVCDTKGARRAVLLSQASTAVTAHTAVHGAHTCTPLTSPLPPRPSLAGGRGGVVFVVGWRVQHPRAVPVADAHAANAHHARRAGARHGPVHRQSPSLRAGPAVAGVRRGHGDGRAAGRCAISARGLPRGALRPQHSPGVVAGETQPPD